MTTTKKNKHAFADLLVSIVIPTIILTRFSGEDDLGPVRGLIIALAFPVGYFFVEWARERQVNFISILGMISVLMTGGIGLLQLDPHWIAVKEAAVPLVLGTVVLGSLKTPYPLVKKLLYNDNLMNTQLVAQVLREKGHEQRFERLLLETSYWLAGSFFLSATLNYGLAKYMVVTNPAENPVAFNEEIGAMTAMSYPVIVLPSLIVLSFALWRLMRGIKILTGLELEAIFQQKH